MLSSSEEVLISINYQFWFGLLGLSSKFEEDPILKSSSIRGRLPLEVIFVMSNSSFLVWTNIFRFKIWGRSNLWLLRYSLKYFEVIFQVPLEVIFIIKKIQCWLGPLSFSLKFEDNWISGSLNILHLKCWGRLRLVLIFIIPISILGWRPKLQFKVWGRSDQWLLRYSTFITLRSSSIVNLGFVI